MSTIPDTAQPAATTAGPTTVASLPEPSEALDTHPEPPIIYTLTVIAGAVAVFTLLAMIGVIWLTSPAVLEASPNQAVIASRVIAAGGVFVAGLTICGLLVAAIALLRHIHAMAEQLGTIEQRASALAERVSSLPTSTPPPAVPPTADPAQTLRLLAEIREMLLLPPEQRQRRYDRLVAVEFQQRFAVAEKAVAARNFHVARQQIEILAERFGEDERLKTAREQIEQVARTAAASDIRTVRQQIQELMGQNRYADAERLARELADKYPDQPDPAGIIEHVCRERQIYEQQHRLRMQAGIQQLVNQRRWIEAAEGTRQFIKTFPVGPDTEVLRTQLSTLEANAEIQMRQRLEAELKQHVGRHQYWDALAVARKIIGEYPFSPQANALRGQIARLEELARVHP